MITIQELLKDKPEALAEVNELISKHDVWVVGGAARVLLYPFLPFPTDIDLLLNTDTSALISVPGAVDNLGDAVSGSGGQGQKITIGATKLDVFDNALTRWLHGVPLNGDGLAIRLSDHFALMTEGFARKVWTETASGYDVSRRPDYLERHRLSLQRDVERIADTAGCDFFGCHDV